MFSSLVIIDDVFINIQDGDILASTNGLVTGIQTLKNRHTKLFKNVNERK